MNIQQITANLTAARAANDNAEIRRWETAYIQLMDQTEARLNRLAAQ
ncbi:hypothetical protein [Nonomuraea sp. NPDC050310]